ncbi:MAG: 1,4-dihydroxy-2-naphthoate polyprenyltransferase [Planctomycetota bacterium]|jgi:1,4-dihydroxy-2-naphthoate octaprenyltransferase
MQLSKLKIWLSSARPKTLPAAISPVLIGAAMALNNGDIDAVILTITFAAAILIQIGTNFANDYYDFLKGADTQHRTGPTRATQAGLVTPTEMEKASIITFALAIRLGCFLVLKGGLPILIIGISSVLCGVLYTAGPLPIGYVGLGELFVLIFFGPVAVGGTYYLQRADITGAVLIAGLAPGLLASAILTVNNLRDISTDKTAGKKTLIVRFGYNFGVAEYIFCIITACLVPVYLCIFYHCHYLSLLCLLTLVAALPPIKTICSKPTAQQLNKLLAQTGMLLVIFSVLFSVGYNL